MDDWRQEIHEDDMRDREPELRGLPAPYVCRCANPEWPGKCPGWTACPNWSGD